MSPTHHSDDTDDAPVLLLDAERWQAAMVGRGYPTVVKQAAAVGCSRPYLTHILKGRKEPGPRIVRQIARAAGAKPSQVFKVADQ